jgi:hypothetical protein
MERVIIQLPPFSRALDALIAQNKLSKFDFEDFEWQLVKNPLVGDVIPGLSRCPRISKTLLNRPIS